MRFFGCAEFPGNSGPIASTIEIRVSIRREWAIRCQTYVDGWSRISNRRSQFQWLRLNIIWNFQSHAIDRIEKFQVISLWYPALHACNHLYSDVIIEVDSHLRLKSTEIDCTVLWNCASSTFLIPTVQTFEFVVKKSPLEVNYSFPNARLFHGPTEFMGNSNDQ